MNVFHRLSGTAAMCRCAGEEQPRFPGRVLFHTERRDRHDCNVRRLYEPLRAAGTHTSRLQCRTSESYRSEDVRRSWRRGLHIGRHDTQGFRTATDEARVVKVRGVGVCMGSQNFFKYNVHFVHTFGRLTTALWFPVILLYCMYDWDNKKLCFRTDDSASVVCSRLI